MAREDQLRFMVQGLARLLGLGEWQLDLQVGGLEDPDNDAEVALSDKQHQARIRFNPDFFGYDARKQRRIVIHELLHVHTHRLLYMAQTLRPSFPVATWLMFWDLFDTQEELMVDRLARAFEENTARIDVVWEDE